VRRYRAICRPDFPLNAYGNIGHADETQGWINTAGANCGRLLRHHAGAYSRAKRWKKRYDMKQGYVADELARSATSCKS
jgi:hypothetical protein